MSYTVEDLIAALSVLDPKATVRLGETGQEDDYGLLDVIDAADGVLLVLESD